MLKDTTLFGEVDKVAIAIQRIKSFEPKEGYYVAFSGGKDSCVVLDLVKRAGVKFDAHYNLTTVDPPELVRFIKDNHPEVEINKPPKSMWQLIEENGMPPIRQMRYCCKILKEGGGEHRHVITGVRWQESIRRRRRQMTERCAIHKGKFYLHPIIDWSETEVWEYIHKNKIPYCCLYDQGYTRMGCILCPMTSYSHRLKDMERYPKYVTAYKRAMKRAIEKGIPRSWKNENEMFDWWIKNEGVKEDKETNLFFDN